MSVKCVGKLHIHVLVILSCSLHSKQSKQSKHVSSLESIVTSMYPSRAQLLSTKQQTANLLQLPTAVYSTTVSQDRFQMAYDFNLKEKILYCHIRYILLSTAY